MSLDHIQSIQCLTIKDCDTRQDLMTTQLNALNLDIGWSFTFGAHYDDPEVQQTYSHLLKNPRRPSVAAIALSHVRCLQKIVDNKESFGMIMEDDIVLKSDFVSQLNTYFTNSPYVVKHMQANPCVLFLTGITSKKPPHNKNNKKKFVDIGPQAGLPCYVINHQAAQLIIDNTFPILCAFDGFMIKFCKSQNIKTFSALPLLTYDLSSVFYKSYWTAKDKVMANKIKSLSMHRSTIQHSFNIVSKDCSAMLNYIIRKKHKTTVKDHTVTSTDESDKIHFCTDLAKTNSRSVLLGAGISSVDQAVTKPIVTYFVRGPDTRDRLLALGYKCPNVFGHLLFLMESVCILPVKPATRLGVLVTPAEYDLIIGKNYPDSIVKNMKLIKLEATTDAEVVAFNKSVPDCKYILTSSLEGLVLAHSYGVPTGWITKEDNTDPDQETVMFHDYYKGVMSVTPAKKYDYDMCHSVLLTEDVVKSPEKVVAMFPNFTPATLRKYRTSLIKELPFALR